MRATCSGVVIGRQHRLIPWHRVIWMRLNGQWGSFLEYVKRVDARDLQCGICGAKGPERCDAGLHS